MCARPAPARHGRVRQDRGGLRHGGRIFGSRRWAVAAPTARVVGRRGWRGVAAARTGPPDRCVRRRRTPTAAGFPGRSRRLPTRLRELGRRDPHRPVVDVRPAPPAGRARHRQLGARRGLDGTRAGQTARLGPAHGGRRHTGRDPGRPAGHHRAPHRHVAGAAGRRRLGRDPGPDRSHSGGRARVRRRRRSRRHRRAGARAAVGRRRARHRRTRYRRPRRRREHAARPRLRLAEQPRHRADRGRLGRGHRPLRAADRRPGGTRLRRSPRPPRPLARHRGRPARGRRPEPALPVPPGHPGRRTVRRPRRRGREADPGRLRRPDRPGGGDLVRLHRQALAEGLERRAATAAGLTRGRRAVQLPVLRLPPRACGTAGRVPGLGGLGERAALRPGAVPARQGGADR